VLIEGLNLSLGLLEDGEGLLEDSIGSGLVPLDVETLLSELGVEREQ
jgi:hypothetical protein